MTICCPYPYYAGESVTDNVREMVLCVGSGLPSDSQGVLTFILKYHWLGV